MKKKIVAYSLLSIIVLVVIGIIVVTLQLTSYNIFTEAETNNKAVKILLSLDYSDFSKDNAETQSEKTRVVSVLLILNPKTNRIGVLELPAYTGSYDEETKSILPLDNIFQKKGYNAYVKVVAQVLNIQTLEYIHITEDNMPKIIDIIGGINIFLSDDENNISEQIDIGATYFDGLYINEYINETENNILNEEILKSSKRKELIIALLTQIKKEHKKLLVSKKINRKLYSYFDTSLSAQSIKNIFVSLESYNLDTMFFQRIDGEMRSVDIDSSTITILFTHSEVGGISNVLQSLETKLAFKNNIESEGEITLTILNGTNTRGLAKETQIIYETAGFNVISIGNAKDAPVERTVLIDRVGNKNKANVVAKVIDLRSIITDITSVDDAGSEFTLILGNDYNEIIKNE